MFGQASLYTVWTGNVWRLKVPCQCRNNDTWTKIYICSLSSLPLPDVSTILINPSVRCEVRTNLPIPSAQENKLHICRRHRTSNIYPKVSVMVCVYVCVYNVDVDVQVVMEVQDIISIILEVFEVKALALSNDPFLCVTIVIYASMCGCFFICSTFNHIKTLQSAVLCSGNISANAEAENCKVQVIYPKMMIAFSFNV